MNTVHNLSWGKTDLFSKWKLMRASQREVKKQNKTRKYYRRANAYSNLSSTYYSVVGTAFAQLKVQFKVGLLEPFLILFWCVTWLPLALWCYWRMLHHSNTVIKLMGGYGRMNANMCDIRQSILFTRGKYAKAIECAEYGLSKESLKAHTCGLLHLGRAKAYFRKNNYSFEAYLQNPKEFFLARNSFALAISSAVQTENSEPLQASRIYRGCADIFRKIGTYSKWTEEFWTEAKLIKKAEQLAKNNTAGDQLLKVQAHS